MAGGSSGARRLAQSKVAASQRTSQAAAIPQKAEPTFTDTVKDTANKAYDATVGEAKRSFNQIKDVGVAVKEHFGKLNKALGGD